MATVLHDLKYGSRMLVKSPGFTIVAVLTLALGIGANAALFSAVNSLLLHPSGVRHPESVVAVRVHYDKLNLKSIAISAPDFAFARENRDVFAAAAITKPQDFNYSSSGFPLRLRGSLVTSQWFDVFEARPFLGRVFTPEEDQPAANRVAVLSYTTWKNVFGADSSLLDRTVLFNQQPYKIIGVMRPHFQWPGTADLWSPLALPPDGYAIDNLFNENFYAVARLQPGVRFTRAAAFMNLLTQRITGDPRAGGYPARSGWGMFVVPITDFVFGDVRTPLLILLGAVGFVLLIACANVAGLLLARASGRTREFAVRTALGASAWRLARQTLTESLLLAFAGMALGLIFASAATRALLALAPESLAAGVTISLDVRVLAFTAFVALLSALIFGAVPAWQIARLDPQENLREGGRGAGTAGRARHRFRNSLVVGQLALALALLAGAGVFLRSLAKLQDVNVGFHTHGLITGALALPDNRYDTPARQIQFFRGAVERLQNSPGVSSAAAAVPLPFSGFGGTASFEIEGRPKLPDDPGPHGGFRLVSPAYFSTLGIRILQGREFSAADMLGAPRVAVIDETLARIYWPDQNPLGKRMRVNSSDPWAEVVGVVASVRHTQVVGEEISTMGNEGSGRGVYYFPMFQVPDNSAFLVARTTRDPARLASALQSAVSSIDPNQPVSDVKTMDQRVQLSLGPRRSAVVLLSAFALMAILLASIGLFGLVRYTVAERTREFGIRLALGAHPADVLRIVLRQGWRLALAGIAIGTLLAFLTTRVLASLLYGVSATDPLTFFSVAVLLVLVALAACYLPARRAMRVDPMVALRYE